MSPKRTFFALLGGIVVLVALSAFGIYTSHTMIVAEGSKLTDLKLEQAVLDERLDSLNQAKRDISEYEELEQIAKAVVPQDKDQARTVLELVTLAREAGISVTSVAFPDSILGQIAGGKKKAETTDPNLTQLTPLDSPKGVYSMEIRIDTDDTTRVTYAQLLNFLGKLERNRRTAQVTSISITPDVDDRNVVAFTLSLTSYVKP